MLQLKKNNNKYGSFGVHGGKLLIYIFGLIENYFKSQIDSTFPI